MTSQIRCHYDVLSVPRDADAATVKKAHRKLALIHHPDKNHHKAADEQEKAALEFKLIQSAYETLSDPMERKWYDEHRDMILRGGMNGDGGGGGGGGDGSSFLFDITPFQEMGCYNGFSDDDPDGFYAIYQSVFDQIFQGEKDGFLGEGNIDLNDMVNAHLENVSFGNSSSNWEDLSSFYAAWEAFSSCLSYAWEDTYHIHDIREAPSRRIRRLMEDENRKKRKTAKKERVEEVCALVRFVKARDRRIKKQREMAKREQAEREVEKRKQAEERKKDIAAAREDWRAEAERNMAEQEAADLNAGRVRLADLVGDDDYDYGGGKRGKKKKGKRKGKGKQNNKQNGGDRDEFDEDGAYVAPDNTDATIDSDTETHNAIVDKELIDSSDPIIESIDEQETSMKIDSNDLDELAQNLNDVGIASDGEGEADSSSEEESEEEPDSWRCECCRKDFKSEKQFENHIKSKKHKETLKKYEKKLQMEAEKAAMSDLMDELDDEE